MTFKNKFFRIITYAIFYIYLFILIKLVLFKFSYCYLLKRVFEYNNLENNIRFANFVPFETIDLYIKRGISYASVTNVLGNIVLFFPLGFMLPVLSKKSQGIFKVSFVGFLVSLLLESIQLVTNLGAFDVDDLILNTLGTLIGILAYKVIKFIMKIDF
ncbi:VanZ family protein [Clostridium sp. ZS2-4]|uniref:VanZ family protein n=1 Tax=Clostridium sp. ZS2-4 TaxID=2987703 RepID=UPI00227BC282|nr:VanZ family protein [Clostridium sp. ZS2-4]MCY6353799.1 VanZ family protein [Clostridium sp. ZS2-4]